LWSEDTYLASILDLENLVRWDILEDELHQLHDMEDLCDRVLGKTILVIHIVMLSCSVRSVNNLADRHSELLGLLGGGGGLGQSKEIGAQVESRGASEKLECV
jgi:hypothetical protein